MGSPHGCRQHARETDVLSWLLVLVFAVIIANARFLPRSRCKVQNDFKRFLEMKNPSNRKDDSKPPARRGPGQGRPEGIRLSPVKGKALWEWIAKNYKSATAMTGPRDLAKPIHAVLMANQFTPPEIPSLEESLPGQFSGGRTFPESSVRGISLLCDVHAFELKSVLESRTENALRIGLEKLTKPYAIAPPQAAVRNAGESADIKLLLQSLGAPRE